MGCKMPLKVYIVDAHLDKFKKNTGASSEKHDLQGVLDFERRYQGKYKENLMGDYVWELLCKT